MSQPPEQVASLPGLEPEQELELAQWQASQLEPLVEVPPEPQKRPPRSWEPPVSSSCILQEQESSSEQTLLPDFVGSRACTFSLVLQISRLEIYSR